VGFEAHLADCPICLAELSGMVGLLSGVVPAGLPPPGPGDEVRVTDLIRRATVHHRACRAPQWNDNLTLQKQPLRQSQVSHGPSHACESW
jgi:hypothetical protein